MSVYQIIIAIILAYLIAHTCKAIHSYKVRGRFEWSILLQYGGMPSSHTATTVALTTALLVETGISYLFVIATLFTVIVMSDAVKVRKKIGEEAEVLNQIIEGENIAHKRLTTMVGHTPQQVLVGLALGVFCGLIVYLF
ncbi:divergent PAP2 family protein [archaeon]|nr:divergent PAP2 family protein [archaeon]